MTTKEIIEEFFEEHCIGSFNLVRYKDKQLLKNGKYREFAEEQIKAAKKIFLTVSFSIVLFVLYTVQFLIEYGADPNWFDLIIGLTALTTLIAITFYACRDYYTIKSSMSLLLKMLNKEAHKAEAN